MNSAYAYHKIIIQLLQWRLPNERWVLKSPGHLPWLDCLFNQYPDAQIIFTHRDPSKVVTSSSSLVSAIHSMGSDKVDIKRNAAYQSRILSNEMDKAMKLRERLSPKAFFDLQFLDLINDPIKAVERIYEYFGRDLSPGHKKRLQVWIRDNPPGKRGHHRYSSENIGIEPDMVRTNFKEYQERFQVPIEK
jgi:hypothetical protein